MRLMVFRDRGGEDGGEFIELSVSSGFVFGSTLTGAARALDGFETGLLYVDQFVGLEGEAPVGVGEDVGDGVGGVGASGVAL